MAYDLSTYQEQVGKIQEVITKTSNIFKILKQESMENKHSIFLSWLFNKDASHGFDERFGQAFFDTCFQDEDDNGKIDAKKITTIRTEVRIGGEKQKKENKDRRRIDILIEGEDFTCTIENKYGSQAHGGQCSDYKEYVQDKYEDFEKNHRNKFVFLDIEQPKDFEIQHESRYANFVFISYRQIAKILDTLLNEDQKDDIERIEPIERVFVKQYREILMENYEDSKELGEVYEIIKEIDMGEIQKLIQIKKSDYEQYNESEKQFLNYVNLYYLKQKRQADELIRNQLVELLNDCNFIYDNYGKKKGVGYAYALPASYKIIDFCDYAYNVGKIKYPEYNLLRTKKLNDKEKKKKEKINQKIKQIKNDIMAEKKDQGTDPLVFQTVDFRAFKDNLDTSIAIIGGLTPGYSKKLCEKINDDFFDKIEELTKKGWRHDFKFYFKTGAGTGDTILEKTVVSQNVDNLKKIFKLENIGKQWRVGDFFSDKFWDYLEELCQDDILEEPRKIEEFLVEKFIKCNLEGMEESLITINKVLEDERCKSLFEKWKTDQGLDFEMDYEKVTKLFEKSEEETIIKGIQDNYLIDTFKAWIQTYTKRKKESIEKVDEIVEPSVRKAVNMIMENRKKDKEKNKKDSNKTDDDSNSEDIKNKRNINSIVSNVIDQRQYKAFYPGYCSVLIYPVPEWKNFKQEFYERTLEGVDLYGYKDWYKNVVFKAKKHLTFEES